MVDDVRVPRATIVVLVRGEELAIARISAAERCDLALVEDILRLRLIGRRLGWSIELRDVDDHLAELVQLMGLPARLRADDQAGASMDGGSPSSANSSG